MNTDKTNGKIGRRFHSALIIPHSSLLFVAADESRSNDLRQLLLFDNPRHAWTTDIGTG